MPVSLGSASHHALTIARSSRVARPVCVHATFSRSVPSESSGRTTGGGGNRSSGFQYQKYFNPFLEIEVVGITVEFTRPRGSGHFELIKFHAKHAPAARVQRFVMSRPQQKVIESGWLVFRELQRT